MTTLTPERLAEIRAISKDVTVCLAPKEWAQLFAYINGLTARIKKLTKPVEDAEVRGLIETHQLDADACNADGRKALGRFHQKHVGVLSRLSHENAALKVLIAKDGEILARLIATERNLADAEAKLAEALTKGEKS
jgi:hypothetical protein